MSPESGTSFQTGVTIVTANATDSSSQQAMCTFTVAVTFITSQPPPAGNGQIPTSGPDPLETSTAASGYFARVKTPINQMHFTAGLPLRLFADVRDPNSWQCPPYHPPYACPDSFVAFYVDGKAVGTIGPDPNNEDMWELRLRNGLRAGDHRITIVFQPTGAVASIQGNSPGVLIHVDPAPQYANTLSLTSDIVLSGSTNLTWNDVTVHGHGFKVIAQPGYSGAVRITKTFIEGLGGFNVYSLSVATTGDVLLDHVVHEASGPIHLDVNGSGTLTVAHTELRQSDGEVFSSADPNAGSVIELGGTTYNAKVFKGNNVGGGIVSLSGPRKWQVGGLTADEGNVVIGLRAVISISSSGSVLQGNYVHHDYPADWSQGFNLITPVGQCGYLAEHNVIREASWTVQNYCGEFRYNLLVDQSRHNTWRTAGNGTVIHHNVFTHLGDHGTGDSGILWLYQGETNISISNNTFHGGGIYTEPVVRLDGGSGLTFFRNNIVSAFTGVGPLLASSVAGVVGTANYNAWYVDAAQAYQPGVVTSAPGSNDVAINPQFAGIPDTEYRIDEGSVWLRQFTVFDVLGYYRSVFRPSSTAFIDTGDPASGAGADRGAVGGGIVDPSDQFGILTGASPSR
jgi:hypothetical protein